MSWYVALCPKTKLCSLIPSPLLLMSRGKIFKCQVRPSSIPVSFTAEKLWKNTAEQVSNSSLQFKYSTTTLEQFRTTQSLAVMSEVNNDSVHFYFCMYYKKNLFCKPSKWKHRLKCRKCQNQLPRLLLQNDSPEAELIRNFLAVAKQNWQFLNSVSKHTFGKQSFKVAVDLMIFSLVDSIKKKSLKNLSHQVLQSPTPKKPSRRILNKQ